MVTLGNRSIGGAMPTDLVLDDEDLTLASAERVHIDAHDVTLAYGKRTDRKWRGGTRRAFVHTKNDGLTINWNGDYPDGVRIEGKKVAVPGALLVGSKPASVKEQPGDVILVGGGQPLVPVAGAGVGLELAFPELDSPPPYDVAHEVRKLRSAVLQLHARVLELEAKLASTPLAP
jgi:hypothetical protein